MVMAMAVQSESLVVDSRASWISMEWTMLLMKSRILAFNLNMLSGDCVEEQNICKVLYTNCGSNSNRRRSQDLGVCILNLLGHLQ